MALPGHVKTFPVLLILWGLLLFSACSKGKPPAQTGGFPAVPVTVATATQKKVPVALSAIGNAEAYSTISVKARAGGYLSRVHIKEGQDVNKGDLLFTIDPRPYEALLKQAEANLARDIAQMENAKRDAIRYEELIKKGYVAKEQYEQFQTNSDALEAVVKADRAALENARLLHEYCFIRSPVSGRTGSLLEHEGNLIKADADTPMLVINQIQPIYVVFSVPEQYLAEIKRYMASGKLEVDAFISGDRERPERGYLSFVDNTVDVKTGTIMLKGTFANEKKRLWPGQFVDVSMTLTSRPDAVVVPSQAVQTGQQGTYVFVVKKDRTVDSRPVQTSLTYGSETVIDKGLEAGEEVVTDGQMLLAPGFRVEIKKGTEIQPAPVEKAVSREKK